MTRYLVEMHGDVREVYSVEAEDEHEAAANWMHGDLLVQESEGVEFYSVQEDV